MTLSRRVRLVDVGPRDGLQNERTWVPTEVKLALIERLQEAGLQTLEVASFVSPTWVPQMADSAAVMAGLAALAARQPTRRTVRYAVLVPNLQGFEAALATPLPPDEIVVFGAASETFSQRNINCSMAASIERFRPVVAAARVRGMLVRGAMSCALGCPFEGAIAPSQVAYLAELMQGIGVQQVSVADTLGVGTPHQVQRAIEAVLPYFGVDQVAGHFHDTYGQALANTLAALELGVRQFDTSVAGLGGCPYAPGATGNVATEDVVYMLHGMGMETGIDLDALVDAGVYISQALGREPNSRVSKAIRAKRCG